MWDKALKPHKPPCIFILIPDRIIAIVVFLQRFELLLLEKTELDAQLEKHESLQERAEAAKRSLTAVNSTLSSRNSALIAQNSTLQENASLSKETSW